MNPHLEQPVLTGGAPLDHCRAVALLFHGRGGAPEDMIAVAERFGLADVAYLAPAAAGNTWYPYSFLEPIERNEPSLSQALAAYAARVAALADALLGQRRLVLLGFSQGACLTAEYAVRHAGRYGGVVLFTGGLIGPPGTSWEQPGSFDGTPIVIGGSVFDPFVPAARMRESADVFRAMGALVTLQLYPGTDHSVTDAEIAAARGILQTVVSAPET